MSELRLGTGTSQTLEANGASTANGLVVQANDADLDNTVVLEPEWHFRLTCGFGASVTAWVPITLILVPLLDGTNVADIDTTNQKFQPDHCGGVFYTATTGTASRRLDVQGAELGPYKYRAYLYNESGQTLSAGWSLVAWPERGGSVS